MEVKLTNRKEEDFELMDIVKYDGEICIILEDSDGDIGVFALGGENRGEHITCIGSVIYSLYPSDVERMELVARSYETQLTWKEGVK